MSTIGNIPLWYKPVKNSSESSFTPSATQFASKRLYNTCRGLFWLPERNSSASLGAKQFLKRTSPTTSTTPGPR
eukprot:1523849-Rhodomonas_salina.1